MRTSLVCAGQYLHVEYDDGTTFVLDRSGRDVWASWPDPLTLEDAATYLLGPIMGLVLRLRGVVCLHASAVVLADRAVALVGPAGAGKSTTAAALAQRGAAVLSDDVVALRETDDGFYVIPAYPQVKLWPDSTAALFGCAEHLPRITPTHPTWDKRYATLGSGGIGYHEAPAPLTAVYVLEERRNLADVPSMRALARRTALLALAGNTYGALFADAAARARELPILARLASALPVASVVPHADPARIGRLCDVILDDFAEHARRSPTAAVR